MRDHGHVLGPSCSDLEAVPGHQPVLCLIMAPSRAQLGPEALQMGLGLTQTLIKGSWMLLSSI